MSKEVPRTTQAPNQDNAKGASQSHTSSLPPTLIRFLHHAPLPPQVTQKQGSPAALPSTLQRSPQRHGGSPHSQQVQKYSLPPLSTISPRLSSSAPAKTNASSIVQMGSRPMDPSGRAMQYTYSMESRRLPPPGTFESFSALPVSFTTSPRMKRARSMSLERFETSPVAPAHTEAGSSSSSAPIAGFSAIPRYGMSGVARGQGRDNRALIPSSTVDSASNRETPVRNKPPVFWGRQQHAEHTTVPPGGQRPSSASPIPPAAQHSVGSSMQSKLSRIHRNLHPSQTAPGPSNTPRSLASKGQKQSSASSKEPPWDDEENAQPEEDQLQDMIDEGKRAPFSIGSSRSGSMGPGGSRTPRSKIEVACDFCRKRKMKCDGLRPTCRNCQKKNVACHYIPVVRRRGPGKKHKSIDARPKKTNRRIKGDARQEKGKGRADVTQSGEERRSGESTPSQRTTPPKASGSGLHYESPMRQFLSGMQQQPGGELHLPSPLQQAASPRLGGRPYTLSSANISPFPSASTSLPPLYPPEQYPLLGRSPRFGSGMFLPRGSPRMSSRELESPYEETYEDANVTISDSGRSIASEIGRQVSGSAILRPASIASNGPGSSESEIGTHPGRHLAKRARMSQDWESDSGLEEGETDEAGPSDDERR